MAHQFAALVYALALWHALVLGPHVQRPARAGLGPTALLALLALRRGGPATGSTPGCAIRVTAGRYAVLRVAATSGIVATAVVVLYVALSAVSPGLPTGR